MKFCMESQVSLQLSRLFLHTAAYEAVLVRRRPSFQDAVSAIRQATDGCFETAAGFNICDPVCRTLLSILQSLLEPGLCLSMQ